MPFDSSAGGTVMGEGAGMLVLEELESAQKRGATILAEITGSGLAGCPGGLKSTAIEEAMSTALENSGLKPADVDCILASADGLLGADKAEALAIQKVFGDGRLVTTAKPLIGEAFGAGGILQVHAALAMLEKQFVPAVKIVAPITEAGKLQIPAETSSKNLKTILLNNLDPDGNAVSILIRQAKA